MLITRIPRRVSDGRVRFLRAALKIVQTRIMLVVIILVLVLAIDCKQLEVHPEFDLTLEQRVRRHGYPIEIHQVPTEDEYLLSLYHIPHGLARSKNKNKNIVLIVHGMGGSPHNFIVLGRERGCPYYFADREMDVWLFSSRGLDGPFEKYHKTLDRDRDDAFWQHSFHEIGKYDLTATIDFILNYTGQEKVNLIGHSAAGPAFFAMFSEKPEYNEKVKLVVNWGSSPVVKHMDQPIILFLAKLGDIIKTIMKLLNLVEFVPFANLLKPTIRKVCSDSELQILCIKISWFIGTHKSFMQRPNDIQVMASNVPRLASMQVIHFMDNLNNGTFRKYDYGPTLNRKHYGTTYPPKYNLSAATIPVAFFVARRDSAIVKEDVFDSMDELPNTVHYSEVPCKLFTHMDFVFGQNATDLLYETTFRLMEDVHNGVIYPPLNVSHLRNE